MKEPRKQRKIKMLEKNGQTLPVPDNDTKSTITPEALAGDGSSGFSSLSTAQERDVFQGAQKSVFSESGEPVRPAVGTPEMIHYDLVSDATPKTIDPAFEMSNSTVTYNTTVATKVEERKGASDTNPTTNSSQTITSEQKHGVRIPGHGGLPRKPSLMLPSQPAEAMKSPTPFAVETIETHSFQSSALSVHKFVQEKFVRIEHTRREEMDHIISLMSSMTAEHDEYKRSCEMRFIAYETEKARLMRENASLTARITVLEIQISSGSSSYHGTADNLEPSIITITTTITTVVTRIEQWKQTIANNKGPFTISPKELEQLLSELSATSSQMQGLQQQYTILSKTSASVQNKLQLMSSLNEEKDRAIASLRAEVDQLTNENREKTRQISAIRMDNEALRNDLSGANSRISELQKRFDVQSSDFGSVGHELQIKTALVDERDRTIASISAEVARLKELDAGKTQQIATMDRDYQKLQQDFSAAAAQVSKLEKCSDAQHKELILAQDEVLANKSSILEKDRKITTLTAEVDGWKRADVAKGEQIAAAHREKEKLQRDLAALSSQMAELHELYNAQSKDIASARTELQVKISLIQEKEQTIISLTTGIAEAKRECSAQEENVLSARKDTEQLRSELSISSSRFADLQKRYEEQSTELHSVRDELHRIQLLIGDDDPSEHAVAQHINEALEKKNKEMERLRQDLAEYTSRNAKILKSYESISKDLRTARNEFEEKITESERTITSLRIQVEQHKNSDAAMTEQLAASRKDIEKYQKELSTYTSQLSELRGRYDTQSGKLVAASKDLQDMKSANDSKERQIVTITAEVDHWKDLDAAKVKQIESTVKKVEELQSDLSASITKLVDLQGRYDAQSLELSSVRNNLQERISLHESEVQKVSSLTAELEQWKQTNGTKTAQIEAIKKQVDELQLRLSTSASEFAELQGRYKAQSQELLTMRQEVQRMTLSEGDRDRRIAALDAEVDEWKRKDVLKEQYIVAAREKAEALQRDLTNSSSEIAQLQKRYEARSKELSDLQAQNTEDGTISSLRSQLKELESSEAKKAEELKDAHKDFEQVSSKLAIASSEVQRWQREDIVRREELALANKDLEKLRRDLSGSSSQIGEYQRSSLELKSKLANASSEVQRWQREDVARREELALANKDLEKLRRDLSGSSSQIVEYQQSSMELKSEIERLKHTDASKADELSALRKKLVQLQEDLSTSSSRITKFQLLIDEQSAELTSLHKQLQASTPPTSADKEQGLSALKLKIEQLERTGATTEKELSHARGELEVLRHKLSSKTEEVYEKGMGEVKDYDAVIRLTTKVDEWLHADAKRAEELALELAKRNKENEELRSDLITLKDIYVRAPVLKEIFQSQTIEIQQRYEEQSRRLESALAERQSQLDVVQRFVATADTYADTAIVQMLQKLNAEVQQSTTLMAEYIVDNFHSRSSKPQKSALQKLSHFIGGALAGRLQTSDLDDVSLYLPIAFQAYLVFSLRWMISSWTVEQGYNDRIKKIYEKLQASEAQTISGRWRSLTRAYISPTCLSDSEALTSDTMQGLADIVIAAGFASSSSEQSKVLSKFKDKVETIILIAGRFSKMIGEVVSADFEVLAASPLDLFEETTMEEDVDDYDKNKQGGTATGQRVLCSTQLGMTKCTPSAEQGKKDKNALTVMKMKVILESFLDG